ncbi:MAG: glycerol-3-phosphate dehydrogenase/oxidase [Gammaproteobacteria bacterium]|nr:glycerol-3-phosphate dehydrogenase/oxidase [Gammaproteobacteria bacterium]
MKRESLLDYSTTTTFDLAVIGGGATGAGIAWDAASRGLATLLVERDDFGHGTSSRSTKLIHGGVRYLAQGRLGLVREALHERRWLLANAATYVHPLTFAIPLAGIGQTLKYRGGLALYDLLAGGSPLPRASLLSNAELVRELPGLRGGFTRAVRYTDAQFDDTRLLLGVLSRAATHGAVVLNYTAATGFLKRTPGQIRGIQVLDRETGRTHEIAARLVINAAGPDVDTVARLDQPAAPLQLTLSRGSHVVVARKFWPSDSALLMPDTPDGRVMFAIPWHDRVLLGTTDVPTSDSAVPRPSSAEVDFILDIAARYLAQAPRRADILSTFAGLRPLAHGDRGPATATTSREHRITIAESGLVSITGGKWTTFRCMAADCVDTALRHHGVAAPPSRTVNDTIPDRVNLYPPRFADPAAPDERLPTFDVALSIGATCQPQAVVRAVRGEMARHVEDVLARRTRMLFLDARAAMTAAPAVAAIIARELGHSNAWEARELKSFAAVAATFLPQP